MGLQLSLSKQPLLVSGRMSGEWLLAWAWLCPHLRLRLYHVAPLGLLLWDGVSGGLRLQLDHVAALRLGRWAMPTLRLSHVRTGAKTITIRITITIGTRIRRKIKSRKWGWVVRRAAPYKWGIGSPIIVDYAIDHQ